MFSNCFKIAWRHSLKNKCFTLINIVSLVMGISLFLVITIWIQDEMSYDKGFENSEDIFRLESELTMQDGSNSSLQTVGWPVGISILENYPEVEALTYMRDWSPVIDVKNKKYYEKALYADEFLFDVFGYQLIEGDAKNALRDPKSIVLSYKLKQKYFGDNNALGKILMISDTIPYQVTGVLKENTHPSHLQFDIIGSFSTICSNDPEYCANEFASGWFDVNVYNYLKLKPNSNDETFGKKIKSVVKVFGSDAIDKTGFKTDILIRPLQDIYLKSGMPTAGGSVGNIKSIRLFLSVGIFILLLACLNFINLTTATSMERSREIGVKKVLGSDRKNIIKQFLIEVSLQCIIACLISLILVVLILPYFNNISGKTFQIVDLFNYKRMALLFGIFLILVPLAGFYPAWVISSFKPIKVLKGQFSHSFSGNLLRKGLVIFQFVVSVGFITSTIVINQQMDFMQNENLGFDKNKILIVDMDKVPWQLRNAKADVFKASLANQNGIVEVSGSAAIPGRTGWGSQFAYPEGKSKKKGFLVEYIPVDFEYIKTLGLILAQGRNFIMNSMLDEEQSLLINESAVKAFGWGSNENAIGKKLSTSGKEGKVIGVLKDYHQHGLQSKIKPLVLGIGPYLNIFAVRYDSISGNNAIAAVTNTWKNIYKDYPLEVSFMDKVLQRQYDKEEKLSTFFKMATFLSIIIASLGLLGLSIYITQKRTKEIGVRKVLGASIFNIVTLLSSDFLKLVVVAIIIAIPISWFIMHKWLQNFAYRIHISLWFLIIAAFAILFITLITVSFQAFKAAVANPVKSLRTE